MARSSDGQGFGVLIDCLGKAIGRVHCSPQVEDLFHRELRQNRKGQTLQTFWLLASEKPGHALTLG